MEKNKIKYFVDIGLIISFLLVFVTGIIKFGKLLRAIGIDLNYKELPMSEITAIHDWSGVFMGLLILIHLILNFDWIISCSKELFKKKVCENEKQT